MNKCCFTQTVCWSCSSHFPFLSERHRQPQGERRHRHRGWSSNSSGPLHVRPPGHGHPNWREGEKLRRSLFPTRVPSRPLALTIDLRFLLQVDIFLMTQPQSGHWVHFDTEMTNSSGRVAYTIPKSKKLGLGVYPIKMVVKYAAFLFSVHIG